jgi:hypothetical protein
VTNNANGTWTVKTSTIRWALGSLGAMVIATVGSLSAAVGGFWNFSSEVRTDIAVMKTQIVTLTGEVHDLRQGLGIVASANGIDRRKE